MHDDEPHLAAAVFAAYGWAEAELLARLLDLNSERVGA